MADDQLLRRLASASGLRAAELRRFLELDAIRLSPGHMEPDLIPRLRRLRRLRRDLGLSVDAVVIIIRLVDRIEALEGTKGGQRYHH